jgi:hypothetical protein
MIIIMGTLRQLKEENPQDFLSNRSYIYSFTTSNHTLHGHIEGDFPRFLSICPDFLEQLSHLAPIY